MNFPSWKQTSACLLVDFRKSFQPGDKRSPSQLVDFGNGLPRRFSRYVCVETLRLVANCNALDSSGLDDSKAPPVQWVWGLSNLRVELRGRLLKISSLN